jgi:hypothetical protein
VERGREHDNKVDALLQRKYTIASGGRKTH